MRSYKRRNVHAEPLFCHKPILTQLRPVMKFPTFRRKPAYNSWKSFRKTVSVQVTPQRNNIYTYACMFVCARAFAVSRWLLTIFTEAKQRQMTRIFLVCLAVTLFFSGTFATETSLDEWAAEDDQAVMNNEDEEQDMDKRGERALCSAKNEKFSR